MYKNQLQELAQRSCFNLPSYACIREGPDHAPRFKATVNFNGEMFESPTFFSTLRQAEHAAAEVALSTLAKRGPSRTLAAIVLDETGVYKNLLQETAHRAGLNLPVYTTVRSGPGHVPVFSCTIELAGMSFTGEPAKTKKQAQKNAATSAWSSLKQMSQRGPSSPMNSGCHEEQEQVVVARFLASLNSSDSSNCQNNLQKGNPWSSTTSKSLFSSPPCSVRSHYQNCGPSNLSLDVSMHHIWLQEQAAEYQQRLMALGIPVPPPRQVVPWMHSLLHPTHYPYFFAGEQPPPATHSQGVSISTASSPVSFSNQLVAEPAKTSSTVTIQEILVRETNDTAKLSPTKVERINIDSEHEVDSRLKEVKEETSPPNKNPHSVSPEVREKQSLEHASDGCTSLRPGEAETQKAVGVESSRPSTRLSHAPTSDYHCSVRTVLPAASRDGPVGYMQRNFRPQVTAPRMQNGVRSYSGRPIIWRMQAGGIHTPFMVPAVQIRSIVPVCAAAPPRPMMSSSQMRPPSEDVRNRTTGDISSISPNLGNLHI